MSTRDLAQSAELERLREALDIALDWIDRDPHPGASISARTIRALTGDAPGARPVVARDEEVRRLGEALTEIRDAATALGQTLPSEWVYYRAEGALTGDGDGGNS